MRDEYERLIMVIFDKSGTKLLELTPDDGSYRYRAIKNGTKVILYYSLTSHVEIPIDSYIEYQGQRYYLWLSSNFKKKGTRNFEYTVEFGGDEGALRKYKLKDTTVTPNRLKFSIVCTPKQLLQLFVDNLNLRDSGWKVGKCIELAERLFSFNNEYIIDALNRVSGDLDTEYDIVNKTLNLWKIEYNKDTPLALSYGKGNGFLPGTGRTNIGDKQPVSILFVEGGERNIDASKYGSTTLLLPRNQELEYEGRKYRTSEDGTFIYRVDKVVPGGQEDSYDGSANYPSRIGTVSEAIVVDEKKNFYDIKDSSIPAALDYSQCRIAGQKATIKFESGRLAGREFDIEQTDDALTGYIHAERRFKIVPAEIEGQVLPNSASRPSAGDKYAIFGIALPTAYICDNATKTGASWDMFREAVRVLYEKGDNQFSFTGELDSNWSKKRWLEIGGKILPGSYILFSDTQYQPEGISIRITGVKDYINKPHSPKIELSNVPVASGKSSQLGKIDANEVVTDNQYKDALNFTRRRYRDAIETLKMLEKAFLNFSTSIDPIAVHTMQLLVGDESLQFRFVKSKTNPVTVAHNITYNNQTKILTAPAGILQHMTMGIKNISSSHKTNEYKFWDMALYNSPPLADPDKSYYLYAKVSKTNGTGSFTLSESAIKIEGEDGYYHLLVGVLNSEFEDERSFVELYGFTEITPGRVTTDRVVSADGQNFIDFVNNAFRVGNDSVFFDFNTKGDGKMRIKGMIVQSDSGTESFIGCFRGVYNSTYTYYNGDEVIYTYNGGTSTYRYIYSEPKKGFAPTNTNYWQIVSSQGSNGIDGDDGIDGNYFEYRYAVNGSRTDPPSLSKTSTTPAGWPTEMPSVGSLQNLWCTVAKKYPSGGLITYWSTPTRLTGYDGVDGDTGPCMVYRGIYGKDKTYYGTSKRVDAVKYNNIYYVARVDAGNGFYNHAPTETDYWNEFGNQFENVATNLLLAEQASIGSWWHSGGKIVSTLTDGNKITLDASAAQIIIESARSGGEHSMDTTQGAIIKLDAANGVVEARSKKNSRVAYMSPSGIFSNNAETDGMPTSSGITHRAAIVGLGNSTVNKSTWSMNTDETIVAGVYGRASNSGTAPAYGGFFYNLRALGVSFGVRYITDSSDYDTRKLGPNNCIVISLSNKGNQPVIYLPNDGVEGRIIIVKQMGTGGIRVDTMGGQHLHDDSSENDYFEIGDGTMGVFIFGKWSVNKVNKEIWSANFFSW